MNIRLVVVALTALLISKQALAEIILEWVPVDNQDLIPGHQTLDLFVDIDGTWCCAAMLVELNQGTFFQHPLGTIITPIRALHPEADPSFEFDTYVTENGLFDITVLGGAGDVGGNAFTTFNETRLDVSWAPPGGQRTSGRIQIARLTLSENAMGTWHLATLGAESPRVDFVGTVQGDILPEPGTLGLLSAGAVLLWRRHSRPGRRTTATSTINI